MRKINSEFLTNFVSEEGSHLQNKDYFAFVELDNYACYVIADGIDKDKEIETAKIAVTEFIREFTNKPTMNRFILAQYLKGVNEEVLSNGKFVRLKASMTVVVTNYKKIRYAVIGNTRFYYFKDGYLNKESEDYSVTQELYEKGDVPLDKMASHRERNNLTSFLGQNDFPYPKISRKIKLKDGDVFALATKGIWENCDAKEIEDCLDGAKEPKEVVDNVEDIILSRQPKHLDNYTLAVTFAKKCYLDPDKKKKIKRAICIGIPIIIVIAIFTGIFMFKRHKKLDAIDQMNQYKVSAETYINNQNFEKANEDYKNALDIAKKYKLKKDMNTFDKDEKFTDNVMSADKLLNNGKFEEALDQYKIALDSCDDITISARNYIDNKIEMAKKGVNVADLLTLGDKRMSDGDLDSAESSYMEAKKLSVDAYMKDERKEAMDKLQQISEQKAKNTQKDEDDKKAAKEQEEKDAEKKEKEEQKADDLLQKAAEFRKQGDTSYVAGDYISARMYYTLAIQAYRDSGDYSILEELQKKIVLMDEKIDETADKKSEADKYVEEASTRLASGDVNSAKVLYSVAKDLYDSLGFTDESKNMSDKISTLNTTSSSNG